MPLPSKSRSSAKFSISQLRNPAMLGMACLVAAAAACPRAQTQTTTPPPVTYTITDLGVLPGGDQPTYQGSGGFAINISGDVAGGSSNSAGVPQPVLFQEGKVINLGPVSGPFGGTAYGINGYDQVTGELEFLAPGTPDGVFNHAFLYSAGTLKDIGTAPGYDSGYGNAINDSGQIAGVSGSKGSPPVNIFLYAAGKFTDIPNFIAPAPGNNINASGQIAGDTRAGAAIYTNGSFQMLSAFSHEGAEATALNDSGDVTGYLYYLESHTHAFLYSNGMGIDIGALPGDFDSVGTGINAARQIVGEDFTPDATVPFLYTPGHGMVSLQSLLPAGSPWQIFTATAINDKGQITGSAGYHGGIPHAYLLSPVFTQFSTLNAVVDLIGKPAHTFAAGGRFILGAKSSGINPLTETTVLQLGGYHISIPPGSFTQTSGVYVYKGKIGNVNLQAVIRPVAANVFLFGVVGQGAVGLPPSYPLNLVLTIGTDTGSQQIDTNYNAGGLTEAEACKIFGLTCS